MLAGRTSQQPRHGRVGVAAVSRSQLLTDRPPQLGSAKQKKNGTELAQRPSLYRFSVFTEACFCQRVSHALRFSLKECRPATSLTQTEGHPRGSILTPQNSNNRNIREVWNKMHNPYHADNHHNQCNRNRTESHANLSAETLYDTSPLQCPRSTDRQLLSLVNKLTIQNVSALKPNSEPCPERASFTSRRGVF